MTFTSRACLALEVPVGAYVETYGGALGRVADVSVRDGQVIIHAVRRFAGRDADTVTIVTRPHLEVSAMIPRAL